MASPRRRLGRAATAGLLAAAALPALWALSCSRGAAIDPTKLRIFFTSDVIGTIEPCG